MREQTGHYSINYRPQLARQWNKCVKHCLEWDSSLTLTYLTLGSSLTYKIKKDRDAGKGRVRLRSCAGKFVQCATSLYIQKCVKFIFCWGFWEPQTLVGELSQAL